MLHASTQKLILTLCELTAQGAVKWREGTDRASRLETEGYVVEVSATPPLFRILTMEEREIERADSELMAGVASPLGADDLAAEVALMAERAHRIARGAETAIARILSSLSAPPDVVSAASAELAPVVDDRTAKSDEDETHIEDVNPGDTPVTLTTDQRATPSEDISSPPDGAAAETPPVDETLEQNEVETAPASRSETPIPPKTSEPVEPKAPLRPMFGAIDSFARSTALSPTPAARPPAAPARAATAPVGLGKVTAGGLLIPASYLARQNANSAAQATKSEAMAVEAPAAAPTPKTERPQSSANPYKPWR